jgi:hypothetical protein
MPVISWYIASNFSISWRCFPESVVMGGEGELDAWPSQRKNKNVNHFRCNWIGGLTVLAMWLLTREVHRRWG